MTAFSDITGQKFGRLVAIKPIRTKNRIMWLVKCSCGKEKIVQGYSLKIGRTKSCGCILIDTPSRRTHGGRHTRLYKTWCDIKQRCYKDTDGSKWYKDKGITICDEWIHDFAAFQHWAITNGYSDDLWIDRIDNALPYSPDNCRWVTPTESARNTSRNYRITAFGETKSLVEWSEDKRCRVSYSMLHDRVRRGWSPEIALVKPKQSNQYK